MFRIVYISGETARFTKDRLQALLEQARAKNALLGITGLLLYKTGNFLQVIEGEEAIVKNLFNEIKMDPRHRRVIPVLQERIAAREFSNWSMGFRDLDLNLDHIPPGFSDLLYTPWTDLDVTRHSETIGKFLRVFMVSTAC